MPVLRPFRTVGNWDSLQRGLRRDYEINTEDTAQGLEIGTRFKEDCDVQRGDGQDRPELATLEIGTRFKEDCDPHTRPLGRLARIGGWKLGLASKRIATAASISSKVRRASWSWKLGLASKRIATLTQFSEGYSPRYLLEIGTRFKEDCDTALLSPSSCTPSLEIGTRFKEDCDPMGISSLRR